MRFLNKPHHHEHINRNKLFVINILSLLMGFAGGLLLYITSSYCKKILGTDNVGWVYLIANGLLLLCLLYIQKFVRIVSKTTLFHLVLIIKITILTALIILIPSYTSLYLLIGYIVFEALSWVLLNMIVESYAIDKDSGKIYGINLTAINLGLIIAPLASTQLITHFGFTGTFYAATIINSIVFLIAYFALHTTPLRFTNNIPFKDLWHKLTVRTDVLEIFTISFALEFFFALMVIFTPLYLRNAGFTWIEIGTIFSIMLIPFLIIEYPIGAIIDKHHNEKTLLLTAFTLIAITSMILSLTYSSTIFFITIILFLSRIGASIAEEIRTVYFYKRIDSRDVDLIAVFGMAKPLAYIVAPAIASLFLLQFSLSDIFALMAIIAVVTLYPIYKLDNSPIENN